MGYIALIQDRYTWRHDTVLKSIHKHLVGIVRKANRENGTTRAKKKPKSVQKFGKQGANLKPRKKNNQSILHSESPTDWHINFDFHHNRTIPPDTHVDTLSRLDIVIYSVSEN